MSHPAATQRTCASPPPVTSYIISQANHDGSEPNCHGALARDNYPQEQMLWTRTCSSLTRRPGALLEKSSPGWQRLPPRTDARRSPPRRAVPPPKEATSIAIGISLSRARSAVPAGSRHRRLPAPRRICGESYSAAPAPAGPAPRRRRRAVQDQCHVQQLVMTHDFPLPPPHASTPRPPAPAAGRLGGPLTFPLERPRAPAGVCGSGVRVAARAAPAGRAGGGGEGRAVEAVGRRERAPRRSCCRAAGEAAGRRGERRGGESWGGGRGGGGVSRGLFTHCRPARCTHFTL